MYVLWGALETICNILYLVGRIDLRFYRPDNFKKDNREIILSASKTANSDYPEAKEADLVSSNQSSQTRV